jgi:riboflavin synthase alpha subunit
VWFEPEAHLRPAVIPKGSIAIDGVSLTVAAVANNLFSVALIPTTLEMTTLMSLKARDRVNIETDIIARTIVHHLSGLSASGGLTLDALREAGFA